MRIQRLGRRVPPAPAVVTEAFDRGDNAYVTEHPTFVPGYPIDLRRPDQRGRARRGYLGDVEWSAARVVARLTGERVYLQDDGSQGAMADMRIERANGRHAVVEVWTDTDRATAAMFSELREPGGRMPAEWATPGLSRLWQVTVSRTTRFRSGPKGEPSLESDLMPVLSEMEAAGETFETVAARDKLMKSTSPRVAQLLALGICAVGSAPAKPGEPGLVRLYPEGIAGPTEQSWEPLLDWVATTLAKPELEDNWAKLIATGARERHFMMGVTWSSPGAVYFALREHPRVPFVAPQLPAAVTDLWVFDAVNFGRVLLWSRGHAWLDACRHWATP